MIAVMTAPWACSVLGIELGVMSGVILDGRFTDWSDFAKGFTTKLRWTKGLGLDPAGGFF
ncbi:hypothetical protein CR492_16585 [Methylocella silvestris]|uniref:Uncharacterized protein n=1 Tax=Methylocella silvestris TaxID=199596 RepID=A0A2J7TDI0_METSI|nr:hypothetical protein CR492_16585 [Methylocella silvestris]